VSEDQKREGRRASETERTLGSLDFFQALAQRGAVLNFEASLVRLDGLVVASLAVQRRALARVAL